MNKEKPFIHPFQTWGGYYMYDVNTDRIIKVNEKVYWYLSEQQKRDIEPDDEVRHDIDLLKKNGFLKSKRVKTINHPDTDLLSSIYNKNINHIIIQVTQGCNLRCSYCAYSGHYEHRDHDRKELSWEMAKDAIDFLIDHSACSDDLSLGFYGGEPLLQFDLIQKCIEYTLNEAEGKKIDFSLTTNATLLTDRMIEVFERYGVNLMISLDGPEEVHDKNRKFAGGKGSFKTIINNVRNIKDKYPEYFKRIYFNMVVDLQSDLNDIQNFILESDILDRLSVKVSTVSNLYVKNEFEEIPEKIHIQQKMDLLKLYLKKLGRIGEEELCLFDREYDDLKVKLYDDLERRSELPDMAHPGGPCTPGRKRIFMTVDGDFYPCERVSENSRVMKLGNLYSGFDVEKVKNIINVAKITDEECRNCWAFSYCNQCAAYADDLKQLSKNKRLEHCKTTLNSVESMFMNYCMLRELGHNFGEFTSEQGEKLYEKNISIPI